MVRQPPLLQSLREPDSYVTIKNECYNCEKCNNTEYPKIMPAVIIAVTNGNKILLSKYANREYTRYALLAGFTEIGESILKMRMKSINSLFTCANLHQQPNPTPRPLQRLFAGQRTTTTPQSSAAQLAECVWLGKHSGFLNQY